MKTFPVKISAIALMFAGLSGHGAQAAPPRVQEAYIPAGDVADAPSGFVEMCRRDRALCLAGHSELTLAETAPASPPADRSAEACTADLRPDANIRPDGCAIGPTAALGQRETARGFSLAAAGQGDRHAPKSEADLIRRVNMGVNGSIRQVSDLVSSGYAERWERPVGGAFGDCEDIAIEKRIRLIEAGYDPSKLFFAVVFKRRFGLHTVLIARTERGDVVLDSLTSQVRPWHKTRYSWLRVQSTDEPVIWRRVGRPTQGILASAPVAGTPPGSGSGEIADPS